MLLSLVDLVSRRLLHAGFDYPDILRRPAPEILTGVASSRRTGWDCSSQSGCLRLRR